MILEERDYQIILEELDLSIFQISKNVLSMESAPGFETNQVEASLGHEIVEHGHQVTLTIRGFFSQGEEKSIVSQHIISNETLNAIKLRLFDVIKMVVNQMFESLKNSIFATGLLTKLTGG
tara:strand:- start:3692 stop:4054 length:363 start_codon:yes stop_codon:yes gene_type:complete